MRFLAGAAVGAFVATLVWLTELYRPEPSPQSVLLSRADADAIRSLDPSLRKDPDGRYLSEPAARPIAKLSYWLPIDVKEERLNQLSDLAIGEAMGGEIGRAMADGARRNLAVLDQMEPPS